MATTFSTDLISLLDGSRAKPAAKSDAKEPQGEAFRKTVESAASDEADAGKNTPETEAAPTGLGAWVMPSPDTATQAQAPEMAGSDGSELAGPSFRNDKGVTPAEAEKAIISAAAGETAIAQASNPDSESVATSPRTGPAPEAGVTGAIEKATAAQAEVSTGKAAPAQAQTELAKAGAEIAVPDAPGEARQNSADVPAEHRSRSDARIPHPGQSPADGGTEAQAAAAARTAPVAPVQAAAPAQAEPKGRARDTLQVRQTDSLPARAEADTDSGITQAKPAAQAPAASAIEPFFPASPDGDSAMIAGSAGKEAGAGHQPAWAAAQPLIQPASVQSAASPLVQMMAASPQAAIVAAPAEIVNIISIKLGADDGQDRLLVQLDPPELGRVSIDFKFDPNGLQHVVVTGESPEAMRQLRQLHFQLAQTLEQHGLSSQDMSFRQQASHQQGNGQPETLSGTHKADAAEAVAAGVPPPAMIGAHQSLSGTARLNIKL